MEHQRQIRAAGKRVDQEAKADVLEMIFSNAFIRATPQFNLSSR
jgi:hypothetical protein